MSQPGYMPQGQYGAYASNHYAPWAATGPSRPGTVTALGVLSIVVASLTFIGAVVGIGQASIQFAMVQASRAMAIAAQRAQTQQLQQQSGVPAGLPATAQGLPAAERDVAINVFASRQPLSSARLAQLDAALAEGGQVMLGARPGLMTSRVVRAAIQSASVGRSPRTNQRGPSLFVLRTGTLELYDDHAVFRPDDHPQDAIRAQGDVNAYLAAHGEPTALAQASTLAAPPPIAIPPPAPPAATRAAASAMGMTMLEAGLSFALAIYLLVAGILTLRGVRAGALLHWIYVGIKALLVVFAFFAWTQFDQAITSLRTAVATPGFPAPTGGSSWFAIGMSTLAGGYLLLVAVLLLIPSTREYYQKQA